MRGVFGSDVSGRWILVVLVVRAQVPQSVRGDLGQRDWSGAGGH